MQGRKWKDCIGEVAKFQVIQTLILKYVIANIFMDICEESNKSFFLVKF